MIDLSNLYDQLFEFESANKEKYYPIHKKLQFGKKGEDLVDWFISNVSFKEKEQVLDLGCGTGNTLFRLALEKGVMGKGISISSKEVKFANSWVVKENLTDQIQFQQQSFDKKIEGEYDKIIAIESLKHSNNIKNSLCNVVKVLSKNGIIAIADDFLEKKSALANQQISLWNAKGFVSINEVVEVLNNIDNFEIFTYNFTHLVVQRPSYSLYLLTFLIHIIRFFVIGQPRVKLDIYLGGLLLERLYKKNEVTYQVVVARKL